MLLQQSIQTGCELRRQQAAAIHHSEPHKRALACRCLHTTWAFNCGCWKSNPHLTPDRLCADSVRHMSGQQPMQHVYGAS